MKPTARDLSHRCLRAGAHRAVVTAIAVVVALALVPSVATAGVVPTAVDTAPALKACLHFGARALCAHLPRDRDPTGAVPGKIGIGYVFYPARDTSQQAVGTIVAQEGGPGYAATASRSYYLELFAPMLEQRNLLLVDQRGTGRSEAINCPELQDLDGPYAPAAAKCAARLGDMAHLYGTDLATDDLAAVIDTLGVGPVDLYGDSYGTFFAQVFAGRHGDLLRTLTLDAAYPTYGEDAWYDTQAPALRRSLEDVCMTNPACTGRPGSTLDRLNDVLARLREEPVTGRAPGADGAEHRVTLDAVTLAYVAYNGTYVSTTYRELDAALAAAMNDDWTPLLRLLAEVDFPGGGTSRPRSYSEGLDAAVSCRDYPQAFDLMAAPEVRREQLADAIAAKEHDDPDVYAPFTVREQVDSGWTTLDWCTDWPVPPEAYRPGPPTPPSGHYPDVPTLVLTGELDTITTPAEGDVVTTQFPNATHVIVAAGLHVTALGDIDDCASEIVRTFVTDASVGDTSCSERIPPLRSAPDFWRSVQEAPPASSVPPRRATASDDRSGRHLRLRAVTVSVAAVGDAVARYWQTYENGGLGLRGGRWHITSGQATSIRLRQYRVTDDLSVSGHIVWRQVAGIVTGRLRPAPADGADAADDSVAAPPTAGHLQVQWDTRTPGARAHVTGHLGGQRIDATVLAP